MSQGCLWQNSYDEETSQDEAEAGNQHKSEIPELIRHPTDLSRPLRAVNERRLETLKPMEMVAVDVAQETRQGRCFVCKSSEIVDFRPSISGTHNGSGALTSDIRELWAGIRNREGCGVEPTYCTLDHPIECRHDGCRRALQILLHLPRSAFGRCMGDKETGQLAGGARRVSETTLDNTTVTQRR